MKSPRVSIIKNNIEKGVRIPNAKNDCTIGQWVDQELANKGHKTDKTGVLDLPEYKIDNKTRKKGSKANHTVGSWLTSKIKETPRYEDTPFYHKAKNQNQVEWDSDFMEVSKVKVVDMEIPAIQCPLKEGYEDCHAQLVAGNTSKEIKSKNGWVVLDGYNNKNSYRMRITDFAMKKIHNISGSRDTFQKHFEELTE